MSEQYYDIDGKPVSLITLVKKDPEWAANRIRSMRKELEVCRDDIEECCNRGLLHQAQEISDE